MARAKVPFESIWQRIVSHERKRFESENGAFSYEVVENALVPNSGQLPLYRAQFEQAARVLPIDDISTIDHLRGAQLLAAILMDPRIRRDDW